MCLTTVVVILSFHHPQRTCLAASRLDLTVLKLVCGAIRGACQRAHMSGVGNVTSTGRRLRQSLSPATSSTMRRAQMLGLRASAHEPLRALPAAPPRGMAPQLSRSNAHLSNFALSPPRSAMCLGCLGRSTTRSTATSAAATAAQSTIRRNGTWGSRAVGNRPSRSAAVARVEALRTARVTATCETATVTGCPNCAGAVF